MGPPTFACWKLSFFPASKVIGEGECFTPSVLLWGGVHVCIACILSFRSYIPSREGKCARVCVGGKMLYSYILLATLGLP